MTAPELPPELLHIYALEIHAVQHCNLMCVGCAQSSPDLPKDEEALSLLQSALANLAPLIRCEKLQILGGEPLLHSRLEDILNVASDSKIAKRLTIKTNGLLLHRAPTAVWQRADEIIVSVYPATARILARKRHYLESLAIEHDVALTFLSFERFFEIMTPHSRDDDALTADIFDSCKYKQYTHSLRAGRVYRCAPSVNVSRPFPGWDENDSVDALDPIALSAGLPSFLNANAPLRSCTRCMGSLGTTFPHTMKRKR